MSKPTEKEGAGKGLWVGVALAIVTFALIAAVLIQNLRSLE